MAIVYLLDDEGGFTAGNTETRITCYAYPTSTYATAARKGQKRLAIATEMLRDERRIGAYYEAEYDERNWARINGKDNA